MALPPPTTEDVSMVMDFTGFNDRNMITSALQAKSNNVEAVVGEYFDSPEKFKTKYGWDESVFASGRDGDEPSAMHGSTNPSFVIHPADGNQVIYGTEPGFYGPTAPSRPPSRANNRSPMGRMLEMSTADFANNAPNNHQEEEALLQRAINESLHASGVQSPQPLPPPPPLPQQSGVTSGGDIPVYFGPANRTDYNPEEWAMVSVKRREADPEAPLRKRALDTPAFLRCRTDEEWKQHRVGGILTILHAIPAVRNALLRTGSQPEYGYGSNPGWWKGELILPPDRQAAKEAEESDVWATEIFPPWTDELHRLLAFLDSTERSYGTADILAESRSATEPSGDREKDFFEEAVTNSAETRTLLSTSVDIVSVLDDQATLATQNFALLDANFQKESSAMLESLYNVWDMFFYTDVGMINHDPANARMAMITQPPEVISIRFCLPDGLLNLINIPETFYLDRYLSSRREEMRQVQFEMSAVTAAFQRSMQLERELTLWVNPQTSKAWDRRVMNKAAIERCQERIQRIKNRAFWRDHEADRVNGRQNYYLSEHEGEPHLFPDEAEAVAHYESQIRQIEKNSADIDRIMNDAILPEREEIARLSRYLSSLLTVPSVEAKWNPTHKYTLRGIVNDINKVFVRKREPSLMEMDEDATPSEQWWKLSCELDNDNAVLSEMTGFETVMREGCGIGSKPILIFATDKSMDETLEPLPDALKTFVKFDNRHLKQELSVADQEKVSQQKDMSYMSTLRALGVERKKKRSDSMDSMATNQASVGDVDDDMQDAPFDRFVVDGTADEGVVDFADQDQDLADLVDVSVSEDTPHSAPPTRVSLDDDRVSPVEEMKEMQERGYAPLVTQPANSIFVAERDAGPNEGPQTNEKERDPY